MSNNKDFKVKNGIQPTVYHEGLGTVVSGSEGYYLAGGSYDSVSFSVSSQDTSPNDLFFKPDGTAFYIVGASTLGHQYTLSTPWDLSTASYASKSFDFSSQASFDGMGLTFKPDGTKMYMSAESSGTVYQYSLSTAWDISTGSYDSKSLTLQSTNPQGLSFNADGTKLFTLEDGSDLIYQYSLSIAYDISTASYDSISFAPTEAGQTRGLTFSSDGLSFFVASNGVDAVYKYTVSSAYDISSAVYDSFLDVSSQESAPAGVQFKSDGAKMYVIGSGSDAIYQYSTTLSTATLDLSTGSVFDYTPTSDVQVTLSNPAASGTVSGATLLLEGAEATGVANTFSTTLYDGNGGTQTITNGIDLSGDGGLVWQKRRNVAENHRIFDTETGEGKYLITNSSAAQGTDAGNGTFNSNGFSISGNNWNTNGADYVSWTFKKEPSFFDVVTYTGDGTANRAISHSLNSSPGMVVVKRTDSAGSWAVWHRSGGFDGIEFKHGLLNSTGDFNNYGRFPTDLDQSSYFNSNVFTVKSDTNTSGATYVAYLFAHDTDASSLIKCGSFVNDASSVNVEVNLGWEPQWLLIKGASSGSGLGHWYIYDNARTGNILSPNQSAAESADTSFELTANGFTPTTNFGGTLIYMAIRAENIPTITYDPTLEWPGGTAPTAPAIGETDVVTFNTRDGGSTYQGVLAIDGAS